MNCLILGDIHLGKSISIGRFNAGSNLNSRIIDQLNLLDWILERAIEHLVYNIIITGDIFEENKPSPHLFTYFISWLKKCQTNNIYVHIIMGNHDMMRIGPILSSSLDVISAIDLNNVTVYKDINTIFIDTLAVTLVPFRDRKSFGVATNLEAVEILKESLTYELSSIPATYKKILIGHLAIEGSIPVGDEIDDMANEIFCPISIFTGYDYVWMGHVHKPQILNKQNPYVAHIGSMDVSNFGETDHKKQIIIFNENFETEYLPTRSLKKIIINIPKETENTTDYVLSELKKIKQEDFNEAIIKLEVNLMDQELKSINKSKINDFLADNKVFSVSGISESKKISLIKKESSNINVAMDVVSSIKTYADTHVNDKNKSDFIDLAIKIYDEYRSNIK